MRSGAECQKRLFFEFDKPIGIQEEIEGDYMVDVMHILAVQHGNLQRIPSYMSIGGLDINALATHMPTKQVYRLQDYLKHWIDGNIGSTPRYKKYYQNLLEMVRLTSESMERFLKTEVNEMLASRMNSRWKIHCMFSVRCSLTNLSYFQWISRILTHFAHHLLTTYEILVTEHIKYLRVSSHH